MLRRRRVWCVAGLVLATAVLVAAVPVPEEDALASLLDGDEQTAGEWVLSEEGQRGQLMDHERAEAVDSTAWRATGTRGAPALCSLARRGDERDDANNGNARGGVCEIEV